MPVSLFDRIIGKQIGDGATADHSVHAAGEVLEFTAPADLYFTQFDISNVETTGIQVTVEVEVSGKIIEWLSSVQIPVGATLSAFEEQKGVLKTGDKIRVRCETASKRVDLWASFIKEINT